MIKYLIQEKKYVLFQLFFSMISTIAFALIPLVIKEMMNNADSLTFQIVFYYSMAYILLVFIGTGLNKYSKYMLANWKSNIEKNIRDDVVSSLLQKEYEKFHTMSSDAYISILSNDVEYLINQYFYVIIDSIVCIIKLIIYGIIMIVFLNIKIGLIICISCLLSLYLPKFIGSKFSLKKKAHLQSMHDMSNIAGDLLSGFSLVSRETYPAMMKLFKKHV